MRKNKEGLFCINGEVVTVLVVEDNPEVVRLIERILDGICLRVIMALDGDRAIETIRNSKERIHLLLTDVVLPHHNGVCVQQAFTEKYPDSQVLYITGWLEASLPSGAKLLRKPFSPGALKEAVYQLLTARIAARIAA